MQTLRLSGPTLSEPRIVRLQKPLTTIGRSSDNDIVVSDAQTKPSHAYFSRGDGDVTVVAVDGDVLSGGKKKSKVKLQLGDKVQLGGLTIELIAEPVAAAVPKASGDADVLSALRKLHRFSERLLNHYEPEELWAALVDAVVEITQADNGFLVLCEPGMPPRIKLGRAKGQLTVSEPDAKLSDSIVAKVLRTEQPVIVSDACKDAEFQNAQSVMHLRLTSVMCVPLRERGQLLGALYVGTSDVRRLFRSADLESLTVIAAQAGLLLRNAHLLSELRRDNQRLGVELEQMRSQAIASAGIGLGASQVMQDVMRTVAKVAQSDVSVLITGETGTGKELVAQEIHRRSPRAKGPFVALNCGAIPEQLLESELFGHVRGAFTGAVANKPGRIQAAQGGSIFLDEIGEMPMPLQVKLLRVLQERVIVRVGDTRPEPVDVRVLSATHRDLPTEIRTGRFREDLFYRLNVVQVQLPPLRERGDDVLLLARSFLRRFADELKLPQRTLSVASELAIRHFAWPGNVRQLENHIKKALVMADRGELEPEDLGLVAPSQNEIIPLADAKDRFARQYVLDALAQCGGNRTRAAQLLGVDPRTVFRFLEREDPVKADS
ncbi:MAG TPA: sigma 54-interacting transcriptional regulator [Pseudomonadota bacterium]|jgi:transcriptional regulator with GAF, ATPase, and Fis domain|nr:sigma 54-interacting transcriptional regulator [Pseudomonadota bacterium]